MFAICELSFPRPDSLRGLKYMLHRDRETERQRDSERETDRQTDRERDRQTDRQTQLRFVLDFVFPKFSTLEVKN